MDELDKYQFILKAGQDMVINVKDYGAKGNGTADDTAAIKAAIAVAANTGGGLIFLPYGTFNISEEIHLPHKEIGLVGVGQGSTLKAVAPIKGAMVKLTGATEYGNRGAPLKDFFLDCNNQADTGLLVGASTGTGYTTVERYFHNIKIQGAKVWGMIVDAAQNCYFSLMNMEYNAGHLYIVNGAGNHVFMKSEFNDVSSTHHLRIDKSKSLAGFGKNGFADTPQMNKFINCLFERGAKYQSNIHIEYGNANSFLYCEFECQGAQAASVYIGPNCSMNSFTECRWAAYGQNKPIIQTSGYQTSLEKLYFENAGGTHIEVKNATYLGQYIAANNNLKIVNAAGDIGGNLRMNTAPRYIYDNPVSSAGDTFPGEFLFNADTLYFRSKNDIKELFAARSIKGSAESPLNAKAPSAVVTLDQPGTWIIEMNARSLDWNHSRSNIFTVRYKKSAANILQTVSPMNAADAVSGTLITALSAVITSVSDNGSTAAVTFITKSTADRVRFSWRAMLWMAAD
ncbi:MAG: right handed beta helix region family protein [Paenibacillaceae bacterium]|jgi:hypothetical protein|nr:right handed beta helix region family protein [Paenibacillaceae bacterium]